MTDPPRRVSSQAATSSSPLPSSTKASVLLIGRHFWPHGSIDSAAYLIGLATDLSRRGLHVEVLTPQYASTWPTRIDFRGLTVHRPVAAPRFDGTIARDWSVNRYVRSLTNWIRDHGAAYDVLMIDRAREESIAAIDAAKLVGCATLVRVGGWQQDSDLRWWQSSRLAGRCMSFTRRADAIVAKSSADHRALVAGAFDSARLTRIDDGFVSETNRTAGDRIEIRRALASINGDLAAPADMPVALCCAPMNSRSGIRMLVESVRVLVSRFPKLHLWFIGDGPDRDSIHEYLRGEGVRDAVAMPGSFAEMKDLFFAANVFVHCDGFGLDSFLRQAVSAGLPLVSVDNESTRAVLAEPAHRGNSPHAGELVTWFQPGKIKSLRVAMRSVLDDHPASLERAQRLRRLMCRERPQHRAVDHYARVIQQLANRSTEPLEPRSGNSRSIKTAS